MKPIRIRPIDSLFFRNGKPFTMGEDVVAGGLFPPPGATIRGLLRTAWFYNHPHQTPLAGKENDPSEKVQIKGPICWLRPHQEGPGFTAFPVPRDLLISRARNRYSPLQLCEIPEGVVLKPLPGVENGASRFLLTSSSDEKVQKNEGFLIHQNDLSKYLQGEFLTGTAISQRDYVTPEPKTGIGRSNQTRSTQEGQLYRQGFFRPEGPEGHCEFIVFANGPEGFHELEGYFPFGGEGRPVSISALENFASIFGDNLSPVLPEKQIFKVYLATPAIFRGGPLPLKLMKKYELKLLAGVTGKSGRIGGWDIQKRRPKPSWRSVQGGAVYYFEAPSGEKAKEAASAIHQTCISEMYPEEGLGWAFCGKVIPQPIPS